MIKKSKATPVEERAYRALAGTLTYQGNGVFPQAALAIPKLQVTTTTRGDDSEENSGRKQDDGRDITTEAVNKITEAEIHMRGLESLYEASHSGNDIMDKMGFYAEFLTRIWPVKSINFFRFYGGVIRNVVFRIFNLDHNTSGSRCGRSWIRS